MALHRNVPAAAGLAEVGALFVGAGENGLDLCGAVDDWCEERLELVESGFVAVGDEGIGRGVELDVDGKVRLDEVDDVGPEVAVRFEASIEHGLFSR